MKRTWSLTLLATLAACGAGGLDVAKFIPPAVDRSTRDLVGHIARGEIDSALTRLGPEISPDTGRALFEDVHRLIEGISVDSLVPVGAQSNTMYGAETYTDRAVTYQVASGGSWYWLSTVWRETETRSTVIGFHWRRYDVDPITASEFTLQGKGAAHYLFLVAMFATVTFTLGAAVWVVRQRGFPRRWLWAFVALLGAWVVTLDWSSGVITTSLFRVQLLGGGAFKGGPGAPWMLSLAFPAGAILAISRVRAWREMRAPAPLTPITPS
jgi:hypothetical protein